MGRLAVLRLGDRVSLVSRPDTDPQAEYRMEIDWREFADASVVEDVDLKITRHKRTPAEKRGTVVTLRDLRCRLARMDVERLARGMLLLADPFAESTQGFRPRLLASEFQDLQKLVERRYFDDAEFHLIAEVNSEGLMRAKVVDWKGNDLFEARIPIYAPSIPIGVTIVPLILDLWAFILKKGELHVQGPRRLRWAKSKNGWASFAECTSISAVSESHLTVVPATIGWT